MDIKEIKTEAQEQYEKVPKDKKLHFVGGALVACFAILLVWLNREWGLWAACLASGAAVGVGYELLQRSQKTGDSDVWDALATASGAAVVAAFVAAVQIFFF